MAHPRAKLTVAGRQLLVERVLAQGWPPARAAEAQGRRAWPTATSSRPICWSATAACC
jgi:leucine-zipper of insertion element IS481